MVTLYVEVVPGMPCVPVQVDPTQGALAEFSAAFNRVVENVRSLEARLDALAGAATDTNPDDDI